MYPDIKFLPGFPVALGLVNLALGNLVWSGRVVSIVTGALTCVPFYFVLKEVRGERTALIGALFAAVMPQLQDFILHSIWFRDFLYTGAEPIAFFFLMSGIALFVYGVRKGRKLLAVAAGAAFGIAYQARPECIVIGGLYALGLVALGVFSDRDRIRHRMACAVLCLAAMVLVALPYLLYLREQAGVWTLSGKALIPEESFRGVEDLFDRNDWATQLRYTFELSPDNKHLESTHWGMDDYHRQKHVGSEHKWKPSATRIIGNVRRFFISVFWVLWPIYLWPFLIVGLVLSLRNCLKGWRALENEFLLLVLLVPGLLLVVRYRIMPRYMLSTCFLLIYLIVLAVEMTGKWLLVLGERGPRLLVGLVALVMALHALIPAIVPNRAVHGYLSSAVEVGQAAKTVADLTDKEPTIMSVHPQVPFRADRRWRTMPVAEAERVFKYALHTDADYLLFGPNHPLKDYEYPFSNARFRYVLFDLRPLKKAGLALDEGALTPGRQVIRGKGSKQARFLLEVKAGPGPKKDESPKKEAAPG
jgi:4-amino-4-deoxy-L-arabinose transferase-like glycosyltransferase